MLVHFPSNAATADARLADSGLGGKALTILSDFETPPGAAPAPLAAGDVDVWRVALDPPAEIAAELRGLLSPEELTRADRLLSARHRRRFAVARGALRQLLGGYLGKRAEAIHFAYGERDKPRLADPSNEPRSLQFNLSHSSELALIAVSAGYDVGIDLEAMRPLEDALAISERFFSAAEHAALDAYPDAERLHAFYRCWTRKEAYVKAVGDGISLRLDHFDVSLDAGEGARLLALAGDAERAAGWSLIHIEPASGYVGALALPARAGNVHCWHWLPETATAVP